MLKETIIHEAYKDGKYTDEPSSLFLYTEEKICRGLLLFFTFL